MNSLAMPEFSAGSDLHFDSIERRPMMDRFSGLVVGGKEEY